MTIPPQLDLTVDRLAQPTRLDLAYVENLMLWPDDAVMRQHAMRAAEVQFGRDNWHLWPPQLARALMSQAVDTKRPSDLIANAKDRVVEGLVAGLLVYRAIAYRDFDPAKSTIEKNVEEISTKLFPKWRLRPKTIHNKVIPRYRPVVHLWAASISSVLLDMKAGVASPFPCRLRELASFLAAAEAFRIRGENIRSSPRSPAPLIRPGDAIAMPLSLNLPKVDIQFG